MVIKVGINGFGRIGRVIFRTCLQNHDIELSAINDPAIDIEYICYLIKFDSTHGKFKGIITHTENEINIGDLTVKVFHEKLPHSVPWQTAGVQYVIEASGMFTCLDKASGHLASDGVRRVIVTAPSVDVPMVIMGVNDNKLSAEQKVLSCASSTLYCLAPIVKVLEENFGVREGFITSIHAMTPSLKPLDGLCLRGRHWRDHRSIHQNIIPASTGACKALAKIIPQVKDKMSGLAFRVPIVNVSVLDLTVRLETSTNIHEIIKRAEKASKSFLQNIIKISNDEAVSSDFSGDSHSCILDADSSLQLKPNFFKIICWYENEYSYACRVLDSIFFSEKQFNKPSRLPCKMTYVRAKTSKKQDEVQQTDRDIKEMSIECNYSNDQAKILCPTSQDTTVKRKPFARPLILKKPLSSHSSGVTMTSSVNRETRKRNELFKIWNDNNDAQKNAARQNRSSFFHSCITFAPKNAEQTDCMKAQERLENVKREFSKMVNITEDLLKKSCSNKLQLETSATSSLEGAKLGVNGPLKEGLFDEAKAIVNERISNINNPPSNNPIFNICGDFNSKAGPLNSSPDNCSKEEVRCCSSGERNENISDYNILSESKQSSETKNQRIVLSPGTCSPKEKSNVKCSYSVTSRSNSASKASEQTKKNFKPINVGKNTQGQTTKTGSKGNDRLSNKLQVRCVMKESKGVFTTVTDNTAAKDSVDHKETEIRVIEGYEELDESCDRRAFDTQTSILTVKKEPDPLEKINYKEFNKYLQNKDYNMHVIDEELKKRNIVLVNSQRDLHSDASMKAFSVDSEHLGSEIDERRRDLNFNKQILESLNRMVPYPRVKEDDKSGCCSPDTTTTISNGDSKRAKPDLYDKLDSESASDSNNSFEINERKSQVIHITDLTTSLEDLARLDKICRIIEISDELSDKLFSSLGQSALGVQPKQWSFRDLCERIRLDDFCNKVFGKNIG